jgi:hypothetical protein
MLKRNHIISSGVPIIRQAIFGSSKASTEGSVSCGDSGVQSIYRVLRIIFKIDVMVANSNSPQFPCKRIDYGKSLEASIDVHISPSTFSPIHRF